MEIDFKQFKFSKSSINALITCPKSFEIGYVNKKKSKPSKAAIKGSKIHSIMEDVNTGKFCASEVNPSYHVHIKNYLNFLRTQKLELPKYAEYKDFDMEIDGLRFGGIVDAVFVQDTRAFVLDYKTGRDKMSLNSYRFELQKYSYLVEKKFGLDVIKYGILYTADGNAMIERNDHKYEELFATIEKAKRILAQKKFDADTGEKCLRCFYKDYCDVFKQGKK